MSKLVKFVRIFFVLLVLVLQVQGLRAQNLKLTDINNFVNCASTGRFTVAVTNGSVVGVYQDGTYGILWGDSEKVTGLTYQAVSLQKHEYKSVGTYNLFFFATPVGGTKPDTLGIVVVNGTTQPAVGIGASQTGTLCVGGVVEFTLSGYDKNSYATQYTLDYGDGKLENLTYEELSAYKGRFSHTYLTSHCDLNRPDGITIRVTAKNECGGTKAATLENTYVIKPPEINFSLPAEACTWQSISLENTTNEEAGTRCDKTIGNNYTWIFENEDHLTYDTVYEYNPVRIYKTPGIYKVILKGDNGYCSGTDKEKRITIIERVVADYSVSENVKEDSVCSGEIVSFINKSTGDKRQHRWEITALTANNGGFLFQNGTNTTSKDIDVKFGYGRYKVLLYAWNHCSDSVKACTIYVKKDPEIKEFKELPKICPGTIIRLSDYISYEWFNNAKRLKWAIEPATGWTFKAGTGLTSESPQIEFNTPGEYKLSVALSGMNCGGDKLTAFRMLTVYDPVVNMDVMLADANEVCEGSKVTISGKPQGVIKSVDWSVENVSGTPFNGVIDAANATVLFPEFGKYIIHSVVSGACEIKSKDFPVTVLRAPEISLRSFPEAHCPGDKFYPGNYVNYLFNGNEHVDITWEVSGPGGATIVDEKTLSPKISFTQWGKYTIKVTLINPTTCNPTDKLVVSQELNVVNPSQSLDIKADQTQICKGEQLTFTNNSSSAVKPTYTWWVNPSGSSSFAPDAGEHSEAPKISFSEQGVYTVSVVVEGVCKKETIPYTVVVKQDPEVTIDPLPSICPAERLDLTKSVHYLWHDDWNGGTESLRKVEWTLLTKPVGADHTPLSSPEWDKLYPTLDLKTPGEYTLQATLVSAADCHGELSAIQKIIVYEPALHINIAPDMKPGQTSLGGNRYQIAQGTSLKFINSSTGQGLVYRWSVDQPSGFTISDVTAKEPEIAFEKYGEYKVRVDLTGTCANDFREFIVIVKGVPQFSFDQINNLCDNGGAIDIRDYLHCDSAGSKNISCAWTIVPDRGYTITEGALSSMFFKIKFDEHATYKLILNAEAEYGGVRKVVETTVNVLNHVITPKAELSRTDGCTNDGLQLNLTNRSVGDSLTYTWRVLPASGWTGDLTVAHPNLRFADYGNYKVYLEVKNICTVSPEVSYDFRAYSKPEVVRLGDRDLGQRCDRDYRFVGAEHVGEIRENNDGLIYVKWKISPVGAVCSNDGAQRPDIQFEGGKTYQIVGEFKNHCKDTVKVDYVLKVDKFEEVELIQPGAVCAMSEPFLLQAQPSGGDWFLRKNENMLVEKPGKQFYFNPNQNKELSVWAVYERGNGTCIDRDSVEVEIRQLPVVDAGTDLDVCLNAGVQELMGVTPVGLETWEGSGVNEKKFFDPMIPGVGRTRLEYWYQDPASGCSNLDTLFVTVHELPDAGFTTSAQQCKGIDSLYVPVQLGKGNVFKWDFGNGETRETEDASATYSYPAIGEYHVVLTAVSSFGCVVKGEAKMVQVLGPPPAALFDVDKASGCGPLDVNLIVNPAYFEGDYYNLQYLWAFGNGEVSTEQQPPMQTFQPRPFDTTYRVAFKVYNVCKSETTTKEITVHSKAVAAFVMNPEKEGCTPVEVTFINRSSGTGNKYVWDFGDGSTSFASDTTHIFTTQSAMSQFTIKLTAFNQCEREGSVVTRTLKVKPNTILARFVKDQSHICEGGIVCFENYSVDKDPTAVLNHSWDFGDGQYSSAWDTCHRYESEGVYHIQIKVDNGCARNVYKDSITVFPIPEIHIEGNRPVCEDSELELTLKSDEPLKDIEWLFDDGTRVSGRANIKHIFEEPGNHQITLQVKADQITACPAKDSVFVEIWSKPRVKILPLDTVACPPFLYEPRIIGTSFDYFRWDYGDGTEITSEMQHLYKNDTNFIQDYDITAFVENNRGCKEEHHGHIKVYNGPKSAWDKIVSFGRPEKVRFINMSRDYTECFWYLPDGRIVNSPDDQELVFEEENTYPLSLVTVNQYGCRDSVYQDYRSYMGGLYFPNTFIPHSSNPRVNRFNGIGMGLKEYHLEIFDLYGNKVWETRRLMNGEPIEGWDGRNKRGELLPQGMYIWRAKAIFYSEDVWTGQNNRSGKSQTTQGSVLMLKE